MGKPIGRVKQMKLVGFIFDEKVTMKPMDDHVARKARKKLNAISRLKQHLDANNLEAMYKAFVQSSLKYGNLEYLSAGTSIKDKLDRDQAAAERMGKFKVESLGSRREASLIDFALKLLDGGGRGLLQDFVPTLKVPTASKTKQLKKVRVKPRLDSRDTSKQYDRRIGGMLPKVWSKLSQELLQNKETGSWQSLTKNRQRFLTGRTLGKINSREQSKPPNTSNIW